MGAGHAISAASSNESPVVEPRRRGGRGLKGMIRYLSFSFVREQTKTLEESIVMVTSSRVYSPFLAIN